MSLVNIIDQSNKSEYTLQLCLCTSAQIFITQFQIVVGTEFQTLLSCLGHIPSPYLSSTFDGILPESYPSPSAKHADRSLPPIPNDVYKTNMGDQMSHTLHGQCIIRMLVQHVRGARILLEHLVIDRTHCMYDPALKLCPVEKQRETLFPSTCHQIILLMVVSF